MEYRLARAADLRQLAELRWQSRTDEDGERPRHGHGEFTTSCEQFLREGLSSGARAYWLAVENDKIISHIFVQQIPMVPRPYKIDDRWGYITNAYTLPERRGEGIGESLMKRVIAWAQAEDLELLIVWPSDRAVSFYHKLGFSADNDILQLTLRPYYDGESASSDPRVAS